mgnify:CR=1 FL=1|jgi:hypothetical protein|tara:strand:+ start:64 stop:477 length:414 start_codon:yes stop_codon:yes gene_type:complete
MLNEIKNIKSEKSDLRKFGITIGIILLIIAVYLFWKENESFQIFLITGIVLSLLGVAIPVILKPIYWVWMIFATILGWVMTRVILCLLFYLILTPIGLISRMFGKHFLELKWNKDDKTFWNYRTKGKIEKENFYKQF